MSQEDDLFCPGDDDDGVFECWCGAVGSIEEMFSPELDGESCGGSGVLNCTCGGDFCVCHYHGETQCPGCPDCERDDDDEYFPEDDDADPVD